METKFYLLDRQDAVTNSTTDFYIVGEINTGSAPSCDLCGQPSGLLSWLPPYVVRIRGFGDIYGDISFGGGVDFLVSENFRTMYESNNFSGLQGFEPVTVVSATLKKKKKTVLHPNYFHVRACISNACVNDRASGIERETGINCPGCGGGSVKRLARIVLTVGTWSGEDVFYARGLPGCVLVTDRFITAYRKAGLSGGNFIDAGTYSYNSSDFSFVETRH